MFPPTSATIRRTTASLLLIAMMNVGLRSAYAERLNVTDQIEYIGNPYLNRYPAESQTYARNIWDMIAFNGKLYLGAGNSSNSGPAPNAGPVPIISYDPKTNSFSSDFVVDEEQIDAFHAIEGRLYVPGHDPKEDWSFGNIYSLSPGVLWQKHRTIPSAIHTFSLASFDKHVFAAIGTQKKMPVAVSADHGKTWHLEYTGSDRVYDFLQVKGKLYSTGVFFSKEILTAMTNGNSDALVSCHEYIPAGEFKPRPDLNDTGLFFPHTLPKTNKTYKVSKRLFWEDKTIFIGSEIHNNNQALPFGVFIASSLEPDNVKIDNIPLPSSTRPWDIIGYGDCVYILLEHTDKDSKRISVIKSNDLKIWKELFYLCTTTFARSFEILNNTLYYSAGGEIGNPWKWHQTEISPDTGKIYAIKLPQ